MISNLEALIALSEEGTMNAAGVVLRISQSAVSKRIATLEYQLGKKLITKEGRKVVLTEEGMGLIKKVNPILAELKSTLAEESQGARQSLVMGVSESILSSWGGPALANIHQSMPQVKYKVHTHRSPRIVERVLSGNYMIGICAGKPMPSSELIIEPLWEEPMVLIPSGLRPFTFPKTGTLPIIAIEKKSASWEVLKHKATELGLVPSQTLESFFSVAQMACADFGHGLVPVGVAQALKIPESHLYPLFKEGLVRPCSMICRKSLFVQNLVQQFFQLLSLEIQKLKK